MHDEQEHCHLRPSLGQRVQNPLLTRDFVCRRISAGAAACGLRALFALFSDGNGVIYA
jgi:hypothetical protein